MFPRPLGISEEELVNWQKYVLMFWSHQNKQEDEAHEGEFTSA